MSIYLSVKVVLQFVNSVHLSPKKNETILKVSAILSNIGDPILFDTERSIYIHSGFRLGSNWGQVSNLP